MQSKITENQYTQISENQNIQIEIIENQNTQNEINGKQNIQNEVTGGQSDIELLKTQDEMSVIDIPNQVEKDKEAEKAKKEKRRKHIIFYQFKYKRVYTTVIIAYVLTRICELAYEAIDSVIFDKEMEDSTNQQIIEDELNNLKVSDILDICLLSPIIEEFIFRSFIFKLINWSGKKVQKKIKFLGIIIRILAFIISSTIFAFGHYGYSFEVLFEEIRSFPFYMISGLFLAYAYNRDGYILASILLHMAYNIIAVLCIHFDINEEWLFSIANISNININYSFKNNNKYHLL